MIGDPSNDQPERPAPDAAPDAQAQPFPSSPLAEMIASPPLPAAPLQSLPPVDPWAHRRGEPRVFALLWTCYVLVAVAGSVLWLATTGRFTATGYGPAARIMLLVVMTGCVLVWPMVRLSQRRPEGSVLGSLVLDVCVVLFPVQMVLWPLVFIAAWPAQVVLAVAVQFLVWTVLAGGVIAACLAGEPHPDLAAPVPRHRTAYMLALVCVVMAAPAIIAARHAAGTGSPGWLAMLSPFSGIPETAGTGVGGPQAPLTISQRKAVVAIGGFSTVFWGIAGFRSVLARDRHPA